MRIALVIFAAIWSATCGSSMAQRSQEVQFLVIGNNTGTEELTKSRLRTIFRGGQQYWADNSRILLALPSSKFREADEIMKYVYDQRATAVHKYWLSLVFQGRAQAPVFLDDPQDVLDYVAKNKGAIGVIMSSSITVPDSMVIRVRE